MRLSLLLFCGLLAACAAPPRAAVALSGVEARHLLGRSGFAAEIPQIEALAGLSHHEAVAQILEQARRQSATGPVTPPPDWSAGWTPPRPAQMSEAGRLALRDTLREQAVELKAWWAREMLDSPAQLTEVMTLFWHGHFTSSLTKVKAPVLLYRQNLLLRRHALGNFGDLLRAIARDPAMLLYLDNAHSRKQAPNENFARELLELFTLGEGRYAEADIKAAARAFTGWSLDPDSGAFRFRPRWHDAGEKRVLGHEGRFTGDEVIDLLLARPETATHIVTKLWRHFISESPDPAAVERLAQVFREAHYDVLPLLSALFTSEAFWAAENRGRLVKSPVDFVIGSLRLFDLPVRRDADLAWLSQRLGQDLFEPPDVKGWPGGTAWITGASLLDRQSLIARVTGSSGAVEMAAGSPAERRRAASFERWVAELPPRWRSAEAMTLLVLALPPVDVEVLDREASGALLRGLLADPTFHLK